MTTNEKTIANFETRLRQMILRFQELKKENQSLHAAIAQSEQNLTKLSLQLEQKQSDYDALKMAKMMEITDGDLNSAKERLSKLIRDVNRCITILTDEKE